MGRFAFFFTAVHFQLNLSFDFRSNEFMYSNFLKLKSMRRKGTLQTSCDIMEKICIVLALYMFFKSDLFMVEEIIEIYRTGFYLLLPVLLHLCTLRYTLHGLKIEDCRKCHYISLSRFSMALNFMQAIKIPYCSICNLLWHWK